jgi:hypothetical protein
MFVLVQMLCRPNVKHVVSVRSALTLRLTPVTSDRLNLGARISFILTDYIS